MEEVTSQATEEVTMQAMKDVMDSLSFMMEVDL